MRGQRVADGALAMSQQRVDLPRRAAASPACRWRHGGRFGRFEVGQFLVQDRAVPCGLHVARHDIGQPEMGIGGARALAEPGLAIRARGATISACRLRGTAGRHAARSVVARGADRGTGRAARPATGHDSRRRRRAGSVPCAPRSGPTGPDRAATTFTSRSNSGLLVSTRDGAEPLRSTRRGFALIGRPGRHRDRAGWRPASASAMLAVWPSTTATSDRLAGRHVHFAAEGGDPPSVVDRSTPSGKPVSTITGIGEVAPGAADEARADGLDDTGGRSGSSRQRPSRGGSRSSGWRRAAPRWPRRGETSSLPSTVAPGSGREPCRNKARRGNACSSSTHGCGWSGCRQSVWPMQRARRRPVSSSSRSPRRMRKVAANRDRR